MIATVYRPSRVKDGRRVVGRMYRGKYRLDPRDKIKDVALHTNDKQVAQQNLRKILENEQNERAGFIRPKREREAMERPLLKHIETFIAERYAVGRDKKYVRELKKKLFVLAAEVPWKYLTDITPESFCAWWRKQKKSPKTLNEYLSAIGALLKSLEQTIGQNPLRHVTRMQVAVEPQRQRRAFSVEELRRLIAAGGERGIIYLVAASTGIRRGELRSLEWRDVVLDVAHPLIFVRKSIAKNHKEARQPLPDYVARELKKVRAIDFGTNERVFKRGMPDMDTFRRDLAAAGIQYKDNEGRFADFHALRKTFSTLLAVVGIAERVRMELNRHSDLRLTAHTYTDASMLPLSGAIGMLPVLMDGGADSQIDSQRIVPESPKLSPAVSTKPGNVNLLPAANEVVSPSKGISVPESPKAIKSAPCRNRTCNQVIHVPCFLVQQLIVAVDQIFVQGDFRGSGLKRNL
jgi:integrase